MKDRIPRWVLPLVGGVALIVLVIVALVREPVSLDPNSPEGAVQLYLQAIANQDYDQAHSVLSEELKDECEPGEIASAVREDSFNAVLGDVTQAGDSVLVEVTVRFNNDPGFLGESYSYNPDPFRMVNENGNWVIADDPWPYFTYRCDFG